MLACLQVNLAAQTSVALELLEAEYARRELWACKNPGRGEREEERRENSSVPSPSLLVAQQMVEGYETAVP